MRIAARAFSLSVSSGVAAARRARARAFAASRALAFTHGEQYGVRGPRRGSGLGPPQRRQTVPAEAVDVKELIGNRLANEHL
jgi:hypothetical protein